MLIPLLVATVGDRGPIAQLPLKKVPRLGYELDTDPRVFDHAESKSELKKLKIEFLAKSPKLGSVTNPVYSGRME
jgi:hypothetical protein